MKKDKSILDFGNLVYSILLKDTKHKRFFTQKEYESNFIVITKINRLECDLQSKINNK